MTKSLSCKYAVIAVLCFFNAIVCTNLYAHKTDTLFFLRKNFLVKTKKAEDPRQMKITPVMGQGTHTAYMIKYNLGNMHIDSAIVVIYDPWKLTIYSKRLDSAQGTFKITSRERFVGRNTVVVQVNGAPILCGFIKGSAIPPDSSSASSSGKSNFKGPHSIAPKCKIKCK